MNRWNDEKIDTFRLSKIEASHGLVRFYKLVFGVFEHNDFREISN